MNRQVIRKDRMEHTKQPHAWKEGTEFKSIRERSLAAGGGR